MVRWCPNVYNCRQCVRVHGKRAYLRAVADEASREERKNGGAQRGERARERERERAVWAGEDR